MNRDKLLKYLADMRHTHYSIWGKYHMQAKGASGWLKQERDEWEMKVRTLDYVMEAIRRNDII